RRLRSVLAAGGRMVEPQPHGHPRWLSRRLLRSSSAHLLLGGGSTLALATPGCTCRIHCSLTRHDLLCLPFWNLVGEAEGVAAGSLEQGEGRWPCSAHSLLS